MEIQQAGRRVLLNATEFSSETVVAAVAIGAAADGGSGEVDFTATAHGRSVGDYVVITGTTDYNGTRKIVTVADVNTFSVEVTWTSNQTGSVVKVFNKGIGIIHLPASTTEITVTVLKADNDKKADWQNPLDIQQLSFTGVAAGKWLGEGIPVQCLAVNSITGGTIGDVRIAY